eukprot:3700696-Amphidinium_carterae.1
MLILSSRPAAQARRSAKPQASVTVDLATRAGSTSCSHACASMRASILMLWGCKGGARHMQTRWLLEWLLGRSRHDPNTQLPARVPRGWTLRCSCFCGVLAVQT